MFYRTALAVKTFFTSLKSLWESSQTTPAVVQKSSGIQIDKYINRRKGKKTINRRWCGRKRGHWTEAGQNQGTKLIQVYVGNETKKSRHIYIYIYTVLWFRLEDADEATLCMSS